VKAINTFHLAGPTHTRSNGAKARIDYVLTCGALSGLVDSCETRPDIDMATWIQDDHCALQTSLKGVAKLLTDVAENEGCAEALAAARQPPPPKYTFDSLRDWYRRVHFQALLHSAWQR